MKHKSFSAQFKTLDEPAGIFEAIVAVFNNVDRGGDRILPGAFKKSLENWGARGRPIPVIFAHEWDNLDAHIGHVLEAKEVEGGLYVKAQLEMDEPFAARVWKKMKTGVLAEFSFAYDVVKAAWVKEEKQDIYDLIELDLLEVGPCLVGMNPETELLGVKSLNIQVIHDMVCKLGAMCSEPHNDGESEGHAEDETRKGKSSGPRPSIVAARIDFEIMEAGVQDAKEY